MDALNQTTAAFKKLKELEYRVVLSAGQGKPLEQIVLNFRDEDLFHILGLQHLSDIELPRNKKALLSLIESGSITEEYLSMSEKYDNESFGFNIRKRIEKAGKLEKYMDSKEFSVSVYRLQHDNRTFIRADYLITCKRDEEEYYIFVRKRKESDTYGIVSCFLKGDVAYWGGKRYLMLKEKIKNGQSLELFRHPNYSET